MLMKNVVVWCFYCFIIFYYYCYIECFRHLKQMEVEPLQKWCNFPVKQEKWT